MSDNASSLTDPLPSDLPAYISHLTTVLDQLTTSSSDLPPRSDLAFHRSLDRSFAKNIDRASSSALQLTEQLLDLVDGKTVNGPTRKGKGRRKLVQEEDVTEGYRRGVVSVVDQLLEDAVSVLYEASVFTHFNRTIVLTI
jgi:exosome complex exonuclease RRP6